MNTQKTFGFAGKNNKGDERKLTLTPDDIMKRGHFMFQSGVVREILTESDYKDFVIQYAEIALKRRRGRGPYIPTTQDIEIYAAFDAGEMTIDEVQKALNLVSKKSAQERMGKVYVAIKQEASSKAN